MLRALVVCAAALLATAPAAVAVDDEMFDMYFAILDQDASGTVTKDELSLFVTNMMDMSGAGDMATDPGLPAIIDTAFTHTDEDHDGFVTREEAAKTQEQVASPRAGVPPPPPSSFVMEIPRYGRLLHRDEFGRGHGRQGGFQHARPGPLDKRPRGILSLGRGSLKAHFPLDPAGAGTRRHVGSQRRVSRRQEGVVLRVLDLLRLEHADERPAGRGARIKKTARFFKKERSRLPHARRTASMCLQRTAVSTRRASRRNGGHEQKSGKHAYRFAPVPCAAGASIATKHRSLGFAQNRVIDRVRSTSTAACDCAPVPF